MYAYVYVVFFFFKQKTAYELRISDWSSDVCSSDLLYGATKSFLIKFSQSLHLEAEGHGVHVTALCPGFTYSEFHDVNGTRAQLSAAKIGSASGRARVRQYV